LTDIARQIAAKAQEIKFIRLEARTFEDIEEIIRNLLSDMISPIPIPIPIQIQERTVTMG
jgi:hypothetical protein